MGLLGWNILATTTGCGTPNPTKIAQSSADINQYRLLELENGLRVVLVQYPETQKAAAALTVGVGSFDEPIEGLAHFLEHMLFLGTKKYPQIDSYQHFVSQHGGSTNAFTEHLSTTYMFDVVADALPEALDRFADFFAAPLLNKEYVDKERHAVDAEYRMHLKNDGWRSIQALRKAWNQKHPAARFTIGSLDTLKDQAQQSLHEAVQAFYQAQYTPAKMTLALVGPQSLEELAGLAEAKFAVIPAAPAAAPQRAPFPELFTAGQLPQRLLIKAVNQAHALSLYFPIPAQQQNYKNSPTRFLEYLFTQTGPGSLYAALVEKHWLKPQGLQSEVWDVEAEHSVFALTFNLTDLGQEHLQELVQYTFNYIRWLESHGLESWLFKQLQHVEELSFRFAVRQQPLDSAIELSKALNLYPYPDLLTHSYVTKAASWRKQELLALLQAMQPRNLLWINSSPRVTGNQVEEYFAVDYALSSIEASELTAMQPSPRVPAKWQLPAKNPFLPDKLQVHTEKLAATAPRLHFVDPSIKIYTLNLAKLQLPHVAAKCLLNHAMLENLPSVVMAQLFTYLFNESMAVHSSNFADAGVYAALEQHRDGFLLSLSAYQERFLVVLQTVLAQLRDYQLSETKFAVARQTLIDNYSNYKNLALYKQAFLYKDLALNPRDYSPADKLKVLSELNYEQFSEYLQQLLRNFIDAEVLIEGNILAKDTAPIAAALHEYLPFNNKLPKASKQNREVPVGSKIVQLAPSNQEANVLLAYYSLQEQYSQHNEYQKKAQFLILDAILSDPFFTSLRTEQQVGYVAMARASWARDSLGFLFLLESPHYKPLDLLARTELFLSTYRTKLAELDNATMDKYRASIREVLLETPKNIFGYLQRDWGVMDEGKIDFDRRNCIIEQLDLLQPSDIITLFDELFSGQIARLVISN
jgi:insulysin